MKDRKTQRAVKNVLHNELGITKEKIDSLVTEYVDKKFDERLEALVKSNYFESRVNTIIQKQSLPIVRETLRNQLASIKIDVSAGTSKPKSVYLITNETNRTVTDIFSELLDAKKELKRLEKNHPDKTFMLVDSELK